MWTNFAIAAVGLLLVIFCLRLNLLAGKILRNLKDAQNSLDLDKDALNSIPDGITILDMNGRILWCNSAYEHMTGWRFAQIKNKKPISFLVSDDDRMTEDEIEEFSFDLNSDIFADYHLVRSVRKDGAVFWNSMSHAILGDPNAENTRIIVTNRDITEEIEQREALRKSKELLEFRADHDTLTSAANREKLGREFRTVRKNAKTEGSEFGILHIDLDHFKAVNDTYGHTAGDAVIVEATERMRKVIRQCDLLARVGGDEFVVVCPQVDGFEVLKDIGDRIISTVEKPVLWEDRSLRIGASVGAAASYIGNSDYDTMVNMADLALYSVKNNGRGFVACFDEAMDKSHARRKKLATELVKAVDNNEFEVYLMPQYSLMAKTVTGFEALIRWNHPSDGVLLPGQFLEIAAESGLLESIDKLAITGGMEALRKVEAAGFEGLQVSLNASADSITRGCYTDFLKWEADRIGLDFGRIAIEVLETTLLSGAESAAEITIKELSETGFRVELDDFGTGYAGLSHLGRLRLDGIKIDRSMINDLPNNLTNQTIVQATIDLCRDLGLQVIAEGVTDCEQIQTLREFGCINVQGFGVAEPQTVNDTIKWMRETDLRNIFAKKQPEEFSSAENQIAS